MDVTVDTWQSLLKLGNADHPFEPNHESLPGGQSYTTFCYYVK